MKKVNFILLTLTFLLLFSACKKKEIPTERRVFGQVTEFGTDIPIAEATIELYSSGTDGIGSSTLLEKTVTTDQNGRFEMNFATEDISSVAVKADKYFDSIEHFLNPGKDNEENFVLDPHAWLHLQVKNVAPADEFDRINLSSSVSSTPGSPENLIGVEVNQNYILQKRGNRATGLYWWAYNSGILQTEHADTILIPAHDTLYYEINY